MPAYPHGYSQQRGEGPEGNAELFYYNQFIVATCRQEAKFGTITTHIRASTTVGASKDVAPRKRRFA